VCAGSGDGGGWADPRGVDLLAPAGAGGHGQRGAGLSPPVTLGWARE
jgi:hypothetical protein